MIHTQEYVYMCMYKQDVRTYAQTQAKSYLSLHTTHMLHACGIELVADFYIICMYIATYISNTSAFPNLQLL